MTTGLSPPAWYEQNRGWWEPLKDRAALSV